MLTQPRPFIFPRIGPGKMHSIFFRYTKLFQIQERQKCFQGKIPHLFQIDKSWPRLYRKIFQHLSKKNI